MSQLLTGSNPAPQLDDPIPQTPPDPSKVPARLSQKTSLSRVGLLHVVFFNVAIRLAMRSRRPNCALSASLLTAVDSPAGAGCPSLVTAVAVVTLLAIVLLTTLVNGA